MYSKVSFTTNSLDPESLVLLPYDPDPPHFKIRPHRQSFLFFGFEIPLPRICDGSDGSFITCKGKETQRTTGNIR